MLERTLGYLLRTLSSRNVAARNHGGINHESQAPAGTNDGPHLGRSIHRCTSLRWRNPCNGGRGRLLDCNQRDAVEGTCRYLTGGDTQFRIAVGCERPTGHFVINYSPWRVSGAAVVYCQAGYTVVSRTFHFR